MASTGGSIPTIQSGSGLPLLLCKAEPRGDDWIPTESRFPMETTALLYIYYILYFQYRIHKEEIRNGRHDYPVTTFKGANPPLLAG